VLELPPELGAARLYVSHDEWRETVENLIVRARLVLIRTGSTPNLWWEDVSTQGAAEVF
jgi:hypothetical protein